MRKFFIGLSILVLVILISTGIHQKIERSQLKDNNNQEVAFILRHNQV